MHRHVVTVDGDGPAGLREPRQLRDALAALGAGPRHVRHLLGQWLHARPLATTYRRDPTFLPRAVRDALPALEARLGAIARVRSRHPGADGSERMLVELADGRAVESVLLPREGVCVSTQVGCAVGCTFCMTGRGGLERQLGALEIVAQVALARAVRPVRKVVFMGMGEPAHNLDATLEAIALLGTEGGFAHKQLVFSTVGDERVFERLPQGPVRPALALSLHTTKAALRAGLLPRAPRIDPARLVERGAAYARETTYPLQLQWTLLAGVNDGDDEVDALARLLEGRLAIVNFIPWNRVDGLPFGRPDPQRAFEMARALRERGVLAAIRQSAGQDVEAGCGQLRARAGGARPVVPIAAGA